MLLGLLPTPAGFQPVEVALAPAEEPVAPMGWTTDTGLAQEGVLVALGPNRLPSPGKGQLPPERCEPPARVIDGGCWVLVGEEQPPCDPPKGKPRKMWPRDGRCWLPVFRAEGPPTSSEPRGGSASVAGPQ